MAKVARAELMIPAKNEDVWRVLVDLPSYPQWNPHIVRAEGDLREGGKLRLTMRMGGITVPFRPTVEEIYEGSVLQWLGTAGVRGIFDGRHRFELTATGDGGTRMVQWEEFTGVAVAAMRSLEEQTSRSFDASNRALAAEVARRQEAQTRSEGGL